jgi:hypothetical protein
MNWIRRNPLLVFGFSTLVYFPFSEWISTTPVGTSFFLWMQWAWILPCLFAAAAIPVVFVCLCLRRTRQQALKYVPVVLLLPLSCILSVRIGNHVRMSRMHKFAQQSTRLVAAIDQYSTEHGTPPAALETLVPDYLSSVPTTRMMTYPRYDYHVGSEASERYPGNPWALSVFTPSGCVNFDMMLYLPEGNYLDFGYGGGFERIGDWAYVHEDSRVAVGPR